MPYASKAQQGLFHSANSPVSKSKVAEFDKESKGQKGLPAKKPNPKKSMMRAQVLRANAENGE